MELLDRYLQAVRKYLPAKRQDDIIAELRTELESQLDDKEAELGRPLTQAEAEAWLKKIGPPIQVAGRYQPQQYLIGPAIFPTYWYVLSMALYWALIIDLIASGIRLLDSMPNAGAVVGAVFQIPGVLMNVAAWVTLIFAAFEFTARQSPEKYGAFAGTPSDWNPSTLPPLEALSDKGKKRRTLAMAVAEVIFGYVFLMWLLLLPKNPWLMLGPGAAALAALPFKLAPVWWTFYWCAVAFQAAQVVWHCVDLWLGTWRGPRLTKKIVLGVAGLIPIVILAAAPNHIYVLLKDGAGQSAMAANAALVNLWTYRAVLIILTIVVLQLLWESWRMGMESWRKHEA